MDKCNKCLKSGNIKKLKIQPIPGSDLINFTSELHLCVDCYNDLLKRLAFNDYSEEQELALFERSLVIFLNNLPEEGKESVLNHYAYGPFITFKRKDEWLKENKLKQILNYESTISKHKRAKPKGLQTPRLDESVCSEAYWVNGDAGFTLSCPLHDVYDAHHCSQCKYFKTGLRLKNDVCSKEQAAKYQKVRKTELEMEKVKQLPLRSRPKKTLKSDKTQSNRNKIGSLEFGKRESKGAK